MTEEVKLFNSLNQEAITNHPLLLKVIEWNGEQLTYFFEEKLIENPFIEFEYPIEHRVSPHSTAHPQSTQMDKEVTSSSPTLETFLFEQIMLLRHTPIREAMVAMVPLIDARGYLPYTYQELAEKLSIEPIIALDGLTLLQQLEPSGVAAYDLRDCLMLQAEQDDHAPTHAYYLLESFFKELTEEDETAILEASSLSLKEVRQCVNYYHTLRPRPSSLFDRINRINLIPDIQLTFMGEEISIQINRQYYPRLIFNQTYYDQMEALANEELLAYIRPQRESYDEIIDTLRIREHLLKRVVKHIVSHQLDYLKGHHESLNPLLLKDIADEMRLSESIVARIVANKNIAYGEKVVPLSDFINVSARKGRSGLSALNIQGYIKRILDTLGEEVTDREIVNQLAKQNIIISSHLVNRYRQNIMAKSQG